MSVFGNFIAVCFQLGLVFEVNLSEYCVISSVFSIFSILLY